MSGLPIPVLDFHAHLPYDGEELWGRWGKAFVQRFGEAKLRYWAQKNYQAQLAWWRAWGFPLPENPQPLPEEAARCYAETVEREGLLGLVFLTGGGNEALARVLKPYPRLYGFAHHDPEDPGSPRELERAVRELGLKGYKVFAPAMTLPLAHPSLDPLWETCERLGIPVIIHFGPLGGGGGIAAGPNISPLALHDVAKAFPRVPFVVPHFGCGYVKELMHLMWVADNVYVDTSGNNEWRRYQWPEPSLKDLFRTFYELFGAERIVFGTDSSHFPRGWVRRYFEEQFRAALEAGIPEEGIHQVFAGNAQRLLGLKM